MHVNIYFRRFWFSYISMTIRITAWILSWCVSIVSNAMHGRGLTETLLVPNVSAGWRAVEGASWLSHRRRRREAEKPKKSGRAGGTRGGWPKNNHFPIGGPLRAVGGLPKTWAHLVLSGIIPTGINCSWNFQLLGLHLLHGYRDLLIISLRLSIRRRVLSVQLSWRAPGNRHQLGSIPCNFYLVVVHSVNDKHVLSLSYEKTT